MAKLEDESAKRRAAFDKLEKVRIEYEEAVVRCDEAQWQWEQREEMPRRWAGLPEAADWLQGHEQALAERQTDLDYAKSDVASAARRHDNAVEEFERNQRRNNVPRAPRPSHWPVVKPLGNGEATTAEA